MTFFYIFVFAGSLLYSGYHNGYQVNMFCRVPGYGLEFCGIEEIPLRGLLHFGKYTRIVKDAVRIELSGLIFAPIMAIVPCLIARSYSAQTVRLWALGLFLVFISIQMFFIARAYAVYDRHKYKLNNADYQENRRADKMEAWGRVYREPCRIVQIGDPIIVHGRKAKLYRYEFQGPFSRWYYRKIGIHNPRRSVPMTEFPIIRKCSVIMLEPGIQVDDVLLCRMDVQPGDTVQAAHRSDIVLGTKWWIIGEKDNPRDYYLL